MVDEPRVFIQSEVSQKEKSNYHILMHIYMCVCVYIYICIIQKDSTDEPICRAAVETQAQRTELSLWGQGEEGEGEMYERVTWKLTLPSVKQIANGNLLFYSGNSNRDSVTTQRGGMGREVVGVFRWEETGVNLWLIHVDVWQKPVQYCKTIILPLIIKKK